MILQQSLTDMEKNPDMFLGFLFGWFLIAAFNLLFVITIQTRRWWCGDDLTYDQFWAQVVFVILGPVSLLCLIVSFVSNILDIIKIRLESLAEKRNTTFIKGRRSAKIFRSLKGEYDA